MRLRSAVGAVATHAAQRADPAARQPPQIGGKNRSSVAERFTPARIATPSRPTSVGAGAAAAGRADRSGRRRSRPCLRRPLTTPGSAGARAVSAAAQPVRPTESRSAAAEPRGAAADRDASRAPRSRRSASTSLERATQRPARRRPPGSRRVHAAPAAPAVPSARAVAPLPGARPVAAAPSARSAATGAAGRRILGVKPAGAGGARRSRRRPRSPAASATRSARCRPQLSRPIPGVRGRATHPRAGRRRAQQARARRDHCRTRRRNGRPSQGVVPACRRSGRGPAGQTVAGSFATTRPSSRSPSATA